MPSGYTAAVADGEITDLKAFALLCARGMGALVTMREEPMSAPVPQALEPSPYYAERVQKAKARFSELDAMTAEQVTAAAKAAHAEAIAARDRYREQKREKAGRYDRMIDQVRAWRGAPEGLKEFMLSQLLESKRFDCSDYEYPVPDEQAPVAWFSEQVAAATVELRRAEDDLDAEIARTNGRNAWLKQLHDSLAAGA